MSNQPKYHMGQMLTRKHSGYLYRIDQIDAFARSKDPSINLGWDYTYNLRAEDQIICFDLKVLTEEFLDQEFTITGNFIVNGSSGYPSSAKDVDRFVQPSKADFLDEEESPSDQLMNALNKQEKKERDFINRLLGRIDVKSATSDDLDNHFSFINPGPHPAEPKKCQHTMQDYYGLSQSYKFCTKCDHKESL